MKTKLYTLLIAFLFSTVSIWAAPDDWKATGDGSDYDNAYQISNEEQLRDVASEINSGNYIDSYFLLTKDIELTKEWIPIGTTSNDFLGTFNGNNNKITGLYINATKDIGFFRAIGIGGFVINLGIEIKDGAEVKGDGNNVGGLVGINNGTINNCYVKGRVSGSYNVGGLIGLQLGNNDIINSYADVTVIGEGNLGGLVGQVEHNNTIKNCFATGSVSGSNWCIGGLVGLLNGNINECYATGIVNGDHGGVGGLVGKVEADNITIENSYATGNVTGGVTGDDWNFGGLVGDIDNHPTHNIGVSIRKCYAMGVVVGNPAQNPGSLVGSTNSNNTIVDCFANDNDNICNFVGGSPPPPSNTEDIAVLLGDLTSKLNSSIWGVSENNYPYLKAVRKHEVTYTIASNAPIIVNYGIYALEIPTSDITYNIAEYEWVDGWWYDAALNGTKVVFPLLVKQDIPLFAIWNQQASITRHPQGNNNLCLTYNQTLSVDAVGSELTYQWYKDGNAIKGATSKEYDIKNAQKSHSGTYKVEIQAHKVLDAQATFGVPVMSDEAVIIAESNPPVIVTDLASNEKKNCKQD
jgi:The GLUG motif.